MNKIILTVLSLLLLPLTSQAYFDSSLKLGTTGPAVTELQEFLISEECLSVNPTGYFGFLTLKGVKCFQTKHGIDPVSGFFGVLSRTKAKEIVAREVEASSADEINEIGAVPPIMVQPPVPQVIIEATSTPAPSVVVPKPTKVMLTYVSWSPVGEPYGLLSIRFRELDEQGNTVPVPNATIKVYNTKDNSTVLSMDSSVGKNSRIRCNTTENIEFGISYPPNTLCTFDYSAPFHDKDNAYIVEVSNGKSVDRRSFITYEPSI